MSGFLSDLELKLARFSIRNSSATRRRIWLKLSKMLSNGVPIIRAIDSLVSRREGMGQGRQHVTVALRHWSKRLNNGETFSDAVSEWVNTDERMLIMGGEKSGELENALTSAAHVMEAKGKIRSAVISGTLYPAFLIFVALAALALFSYEIVPAFTSAIQGRDPWTGLARNLVDMSNFVQSYMVFIILAVGLVITVFFIALPRWTNRLSGVRIVLDRYPPFAIYRIVQGSSWLLSFAAMIESGMRVEVALSSIERHASPWLSVRIKACLRGMRAGLNIGNALASSGYEFPDREIIDDMSVYSDLSGFDEALKILGNEWLDEGIIQVQKQMKTIFMAGIVIVGGMLAFMIGGMFAMQMQLTDALRVM